MHKFGTLTTVTEHAYFYPDLSDLSQYRFSLDAPRSPRSRNGLAAISISDRYVTDPPILGTKSNDVIMSTGLNVTSPIDPDHQEIPGMAQRRSSKLGFGIGPPGQSRRPLES